MKKVIYINFLFCLLIFTYSQDNPPYGHSDLHLTLTEAGKAKALECLRLGKTGYIDVCVENNLIEARQIIEENFAGYDNTAKTCGIEALYYFNSDSTLIFARRFYPELKNSVVPSRNPMSRNDLNRIDVATVMARLGDHTYTNEIIGLIDSSKFTFKNYYNFLDAIHDFPEYENYVRSKLTDAIINEQTGLDRKTALTYFQSYYNADAIPFLKSMLNNDPDYISRSMCVEDLLSFNDKNIINYLIENIKTQPHPDVRIEIAMRILNDSIEPKHFNLIKKHYDQETEDNVRMMIDVSLDVFEPAKPDSTVTAGELLDSLISYNNQCYEYGWLASEDLKNKFDRYLNLVKVFLPGGNIDKSIKTLREMIDIVEERTGQ